MKKFILGLILCFTISFSTPTPTYAFLGGFSSAIGSISGAVSQVGGIVGGIGGIIGEVRGLFGGGGGGGSNQPATGLFDGDAARIFEGGLQGGLNVGVDNIVSSGVVIVQDFDAIFQSVEGRVGVTPDGQFVLPDPEQFNQIGENTSLRQYILNVLNFALTFLGLIAVAFIVYAGFLYVTSGGDEGNMEKAKKIILYAVIGILVILAAFALVNTVIQNAGRGTGDRGEIPEGSIPTGSTVNSNGTITLPNGTILTTPNGSGGNTTPTISGNLANLITVSGTGVQDFGSTAVATPEGALNGITFGLNTQAQALFDFGDGTQAVLNTVDNPTATVVHPFGEERSYSVRVIIENAEGSLPVRKEIVVGGLNAQFNMNRAEVSVGEALSLDASTTQVTVGSISSYAWTCSGGAGCFGETIGRQQSVAFTAPGEYDVTLTVGNVLGLTDSVTKRIRVIGGAPVASFNVQSAQNAQAPAQFTFNAGESVNRTGDNNGLTYFWNFDGDFLESRTPSVNYEFTSVGDKTVELVVVERIQGNPLNSETVTQTVNVETIIPVDFTIE